MLGVVRRSRKLLGVSGPAELELIGSVLAGAGSVASGQESIATAGNDDCPLHSGIGSFPTGTRSVLTAGEPPTCTPPIPPPPPLVAATGLTFEFLVKVTPGTPPGTPGVYTLAACEPPVVTSNEPSWLFDHDFGSHGQGQFGLGYGCWTYGYQQGNSNYGGMILPPPPPVPPGLPDDAGTYHYWAYRITHISGGPPPAATPFQQRLEVFRDGVLVATFPLIFNTRSSGTNLQLRLGGNYDHASLVGTMSCVRLNNYPVPTADLLANATAVLAGGLPSIIPTHTVGLWLLQNDLLDTAGQGPIDMTIQQAIAPTFVATGIGSLKALSFNGSINTVTAFNALLQCGQAG